MNKDILDHRVWSCLTKEEQQSLSLTLSYNKSSWEAGEILGITHYKYLELKQRSERLFRLFFDYFSMYPTLIRPNPPIDQRFVDFIEACLEKRVTRKEACKAYGDSTMYVSKIKNRFILKQMDFLKSSEDKWDNDLYRLIIEFDRWNNYRILPRVLQQPSAYKRRNNRRDIFYLNYMCNLGDDKVKILIDKFWYNRNKEKSYVTVFSYNLFDDGYLVVPVKKLEETLEELSRLFIYVFPDEDSADIYGYLVTKYQYDRKSATKGQVFWPNYREVIKKAVNYNSVNNIDFYCEKLDMAYDVKKDSRAISKKEKKLTKQSTKGVKRSNPTNFY